MGTNKIKCPKCKRIGTLRLREKGKNALVISHYDPNLYKNNKNKGTRSCYIGSSRRSTRELFLKYTQYDKHSGEFIEFEKQIGKIRSSLLNKTNAKQPSFTTEQETMIGILHNLVKIHTFEKRMLKEAKEGLVWSDVKCRVCDAPHTITIFARKRRRDPYWETHLGEPYYEWKMQHKLKPIIK